MREEAVSIRESSLDTRERLIGATSSHKAQEEKKVLLINICIFIYRCGAVYVEIDM